MIGRLFEQKELKRIFVSTKSEFVLIYGRRRVGKTYLVREFFHDKFVFSCTGIANGSKREELQNFRTELMRRDIRGECPVLENWMEAFGLLRALVERSSEKRKVIFLDELPWMYTQKSDFIKALEHFWNDWAAQQKNVILIVCGSAASWMIRKIVKSKGGLHDRITLSMRLLPFDLSQTKVFLRSNRISWDIKTIAECYMILGGIPYYLSLLDASLSLAQNIDRLFFDGAAILGTEFENLYASLFKNSRDYVTIVDILSRRKSGYQREEIVQKGKFKDGGSVTDKLEDLEECGFVRKYASAGNARGLYQLTDFFTLFYFQFIRKGAFEDRNYWMHMQGRAAYNTWKGLAFERLCFSHLEQIKKALGVSGVWTKAFSYYSAAGQIDMILERGDRVINIIEVKYHDTPYAVAKADAEKFVRNRAMVAALYKKRMSYMTVLIAADGIVSNGHASSSVQLVLTLEDLF